MPTSRLRIIDRPMCNVSIEWLQERLGHTVYFLCKNRITKGKIINIFTVYDGTLGFVAQYDIYKQGAYLERHEASCKTYVYMNRNIVSDTAEGLCSDLLQYHKNNSLPPV